jgi:UDP-2-acetamido-3-amino-2,3-dideoxy-glucuronate N-acetyltransferase
MPIDNVRRGDDVVMKYPDLVNLYGCMIGQGTRIGPFVQIQKGTAIGRNCKVSSHSRRASIGSNATTIASVAVGEGALVGAGTVVTKDVPDYAVAVGNPARLIGDVRDRERKRVIRDAAALQPHPLTSNGPAR